MDIIVITLLLVLLVGGLLALTLGGGQSSHKTSAAPMAACPPGFSPSLAYIEKYGDTGIAYDETQKAICLLHPDAQRSQIVSYHNILAAAVFEDESLVAKSARTDEHGKQLLTHILSEEIKALFQDNVEPSKGEQPSSSGGTSNNIVLRILINNPEHPVHQITFLNMEAKKGGVIHNEAVSHVKNWQDLLSFLIRLAGKTTPQPGQTQPPYAQQAAPEQPTQPTTVAAS